MSGLAKFKSYSFPLKVAFKNFPLPFHNHAQGAAVAGLCANEQGADKFWKMHDEMFAHQDALDAAGLAATAGKIGLKKEAFELCLKDKKYLAQVNGDMEDGKKVSKEILMILTHLVIFFWILSNWLYWAWSVYCVISNDSHKISNTLMMLM